MKKVIYATLLLSIVFILSCEKMYLGEATENTPENNFELFWEDFDQHYGLFMARGWNWDSLYTVYRPQVTPQTTDEDLWEIFKQMLEYLDDGHTFMAIPGQKGFLSGAADWETISEELSLDLLKDKYVDAIDDIEVGGFASFYGKLKDKDIGYVYLQGIETSKPKVMDEILEAIGQHQAIIVDVRGNQGGDDITAKELAGRFADKERLVFTAEERNGPEHGDFSEKRPHFSEVLGKENFAKPIILLTDGMTVSAGEIFVWYMKSFVDRNIHQLGTTTAGDFSYTSNVRFLPNGWLYSYSTMMYLSPEGKSLDGIGHIPEVDVRNSKADIEAGEDKVMERAIGYLLEEYGIE